MRQLPAGWTWSSIAGVADIASDLVDPADHLDAPHVAPNHIEGHTGRLSGVLTVRQDGVTSPKHRFRSGQILYSKIRPYLAKATLAPCGGLCSADMYPIDAHTNAAFLLWWMLSDEFTAIAATHQGRSVLPKINQEALRTIPVPLAPLAEQARIVAAIEEAFSLIDAGETALHSTRTRLTRMRESVLTAAVTGQLVSQDPQDESATARLAELGVEVLARAESFPPTPGSWEWIATGDAGGIELGRQRHPDWHHGPNMRPYLRVANVFEARIDSQDVKEMHFEPETFERFRLRDGDVLLNEGQSPELLGRPAIYRGDPPDTAFTNSLIRFQPHAFTTSEWALLVFRFYMHTGRFTRESRITTNIAHLSANRLKSVEFPVPPLREQQRIVAEVDRQFSFIDACERSVADGLARSQALRRSVLQAGFAGELVPQDPTDEPASVLLERIRASRPSPVTGSRARGRKVAS